LIFGSFCQEKERNGAYVR